MSSHLTVWSTWWMIVYTEFQLCRMYGFLIIHLAFLVHVKPSPTASEADEELLTEGDLERERERAGSVLVLDRVDDMCIPCFNWSVKVFDLSSLSEAYTFVMVLFLFRIGVPTNMHLLISKR